jgi:hypothetical protein
MDLEKKIKLPYILKNKVLFGPGIWNNNRYSENEIKDAFYRTNWESKETKSLFLDHSDKNTKDWIGFVENPRFEDNGKILADIYVVDKQLAMKLEYGAKFGISPKVQGFEDKGDLKSFDFQNWSVVVTPACKLTYINNKEENIMKKADDVLVNLEEDPKQEETKIKNLSQALEWVKSNSPKEVTELILGEIEKEEPEEPKEPEDKGKDEEEVKKLHEKIKDLTEKIKLLEEKEEPKEEPKEDEEPVKEKNLSEKELKEKIKSVLKELSEEDKPSRATVKTEELSKKPVKKYNSVEHGMLAFIKEGGEGTFSL